MKIANSFLCALLLAGAPAFIGCADAESDDGAAGTDGSDTPEDPGFGTEADLAVATQLWDDIAAYRDWKVPAGFEGFVASGAPHGEFVRLFVNEAAAADPSFATDGSIVVKENFASASNDALGAITVMYKRAGYAPDYADWFWVKFSPDGTIDESPGGVPLAGQVGANGPGCISCHAMAEGDDYVHIN